jgi:transcriptional regulator with XRE-family HTH domain
MARSVRPDPALGNALRKLRVAREMSQESVSHAADLTLGAYGRIERSEVAPSWTTVRAIAKALDISMEELGAVVDGLGKSSKRP